MEERSKSLLSKIIDKNAGEAKERIKEFLDAQGQE